MNQRKKTSTLRHLISICGALLATGITATAFAAPTITAKLTANPANYSGKCPATIKFDGEISVRGMTRGPLTVTYEFTRSDGAKDTKFKTLTFQKDGSLPVSTTWTLGGEKLPTFSGWQAVKVTAPTPAESNKATFSLKCSAEEKKAEADDFKPELTRFEEKPLRKLPARLSTNELELVKKFKLTPAAVTNIVKTDLVCQIKAYYDPAHTMPVQTVGANTGLYHIKNGPARPLPYYAFFEVTVKNQGLVNPAPNVTNKVFFTSAPPLFPPKQFITVPETFSPGEAAEYKYWWGYFTPAAMVLNNKIIHVQATTDFPPHVAEDNEANNVCNYQLRFVYP